MQKTPENGSAVTSPERCKPSTREERLDTLRELQQSNQLGLSSHVAIHRESDVPKLLVGINGFGRLGRMVARAIGHVKAIEIVHVNEPFAQPDYMACMYSCESDRADDRGPRFSTMRDANGKEALLLESRPVTVTHAREPSGIPWGSSGAQYVIECSGLFTSRSAANGHLRGAVRKVFVAGTSKDVPALILGVNHQMAPLGAYNGESLISNGPRAAHCAGCLLSTLHQTFGVEAASVTVLAAGAGGRGNAYGTGERARRDPSGSGFRSSHEGRKDVVPEWSDAAAALQRAIPALSGRIAGITFDTPATKVSCLDLTVKLTTATSLEKVGEAVRAAAEAWLHGMVSVREDSVDAADVVGDACSCVLDLSASFALNPTFFKLVGWWDNDWPYVMRLVELMLFIRGTQPAVTQHANKLYTKDHMTAHEQHTKRADQPPSEASISSSMRVASRGSSFSTLSEASLRAAAALPENYKKAANIACADSADVKGYVGLDALKPGSPRGASRANRDLA